MFKRKAKRILVQKPKAITQQGFGTEMPPERQVVAIYFDQKGLPEQAAAFYDFYEESNWRSPKGTPFRNWKVLATDWVYNYQQEVKLRRRLRGNRSVI